MPFVLERSFHARGPSNQELGAVSTEFKIIKGQESTFQNVNSRDDFCGKNNCRLAVTSLKDRLCWNKKQQLRGRVGRTGLPFVSELSGQQGAPPPCSVLVGPTEYWFQLKGKLGVCRR